MIDTIWLSTQCYKILDKHSLDIDPPTIRSSKIPEEKAYEQIASPDGVLIDFKKAYRNENIWNVTIEPPYMHLQMSIPRINSATARNPSGNNLEPVCMAEAFACLELVEEQVSDAGVVFSLDNCFVSRLDLFRNIQTDLKYLDYAPLFSVLKPKRAERKKYKTTFYWGNKSWEICIYDKTREMLEKGLAEEVPSDNILRCEYRIFGHKNVCKVLNQKKCPVLFLFEKWKELDGIYKNAIKTKILNSVSDSSEYFADENLSFRVRRYKGDGDRNWLGRMLKDSGIDFLTQQYSDEEIKHALIDAELNRSQISRVMNQVSEVKQSKVMNSKNDQGKMRNLYMEIEEKLLA